MFSDEFKELYGNKKRVAIIMEDDVVVEERILVDYISIPHKIVGVCRHCNNIPPNNREDEDMFALYLFYNKHNLAKECDALAFGFAEDITHLFSVNTSPSFKKDYYLQKA